MKRWLLILTMAATTAGYPGIFSNQIFSNETKNILINYQDDYQKLSIRHQQKYSDWDQLDYYNIKSLEAELQETMYGQDYVVNKTNDTIIKMYTGMNKIFGEGKPAGVLFLVGPPGVGKSFLPKQLAKSIFGKSDFKEYLYKFNMADYDTLDSNSTFIKDLTKVSQNKINILLFDEIEKAHVSIWDKFLEILSNGKLNDNKDKSIDFSKSLIIFTANIGTSVVDERKSNEEIRNQFKEQVKYYFNDELKRPELLSRIGLSNIVPFDFIKDEKNQKKVFVDYISKIKKAIVAKYNIQFVLNIDKIFDFFKKDIDVRLGMRSIRNSIEKNLVDSLASFLFKNKNDIDKIYQDNNWQIVCTIKNNKISYHFLKE